MFTLRFLRCLLFMFVLAGATSAIAQEKVGATAKSAVIAPFLDANTLAVGRVDLRAIDVAAALQTIGRLAPESDQQFAAQMRGLEQPAKAMLNSVTAAGIDELYFIVSLTDLGPRRQPLFFVAPVMPGHEPQKAAGQLREILRFDGSDVRGNTVVVGAQTTIDRLKRLQPAARPELTQALQRAADAAVQIVLAPSDDTRRVVREMLPRLPDEIGGGSGRMLADGFQWAVVTVSAPPNFAIKVQLQSKDADAAVALRGIAVSALQFAARQESLRRQWPQFDDFARLVTPQIAGDKLTISLTGTAAEQGLKLLAAPIQAARTAAGRAQSINNLNQIGLALHNYHDRHGRFPPQAIRGKDGRALLSWRVAILPFLEQDALYRQFHLDEPWDSEHNKQLIEKMSPIFASPALGPERPRQGLTSYAVPLTSPPPAVAQGPDARDVPPTKPQTNVAPQTATIFDGAQGTKLPQITDGVSNTIACLELRPQSAVVWTRPDDLVVDDRNPFQDLVGQPNDGFAALFADGSVRFLKTAIETEKFWRLLKMNDGQPVEDF